MLKLHSLIAALLLLPSVAAAQLSTLETNELRLVYLQPLQSYLAPHVARCFHNSLATQRKLFGYESDEKITVILTDFADYGNAGAGAVPRNGVAVTIAPMSLAYETYPSNERMNTLMNHELVHVVNFDRTAGWDGFFRGLFRGKVSAKAEHPESIVYNYLTSPRSSAPRWFHEGIAVCVETWMAGGLGRAQGSYDEMVFRSMVRDGTRFYDPLGLVAEGTSANFQIEMNSYLYGTRFMSWLAYEHTPEKLIDWVKRDRGSRGHYAAQFERVYGRSLDEMWEEWGEFETRWQTESLDSLRVYPITEHRDISARALGSVSRAYYDGERRQLYAALNYPGKIAHLAAIDVDSGEIHRLLDVKDPLMYSVTSLAHDPEGRRLFYTRDHSAFRDIVEYDLESRKSRMLLKDARVGELAFDRSDASLWGVRHDNGWATIVRIPAPYEEWNQIVTFGYGSTVYDLDLSPDGSQICYGIVDIGGKGEVTVVSRDSLLAGSTTPTARFDFGTTTPGSFSFTPNGTALVGSSYLTGVSNIFRYRLESGELEALSNTETGFFRPITTANDEMIVFRYSGEGFVPTWISATPLEDINPIRLFGAALREKYPQLGEWRAGSPADVALESLQTYKGDYRALRSVELESLVPIVEGYKDYTAVGLRADLSDPISLHKFHLAASYSPSEGLPEDERIHAQAGYERYDWSASFKWNDADFYDLFGPTKSSRKGWSGGLGYSRTLVHDLPRELDFQTHVAHFGNLERLPDYQNVSSSFDKLLTGSVRLDWRNRSFSIGAVDYERGSTASLALADNHVNGRSFANSVATLDLGLPLFAHSSVWLRSAGGWAPAEHDEPFANFFFGGFGNNWLDHQHPKRYRGWSSFPGFELNEIGGTNFVKAMVDWNLPPLRFASLGRPAFYASWVRASLFSGGLVTNLDDSMLRREVMNVGGQLDLQMHFLSHLDLTASVGWAFGIEEGTKPKEELMLSLKIL
jgi:hypothetical protein